MDMNDYIKQLDQESVEEVARDISRFKRNYEEIEIRKLNARNKKIAIRINFAFEHLEFIRKQKEDGRDHKEVLKISSF